jgi:BirA family transcriptional regulator, biotin operon repressor / biotin---[acetyl-CoA-carboxylase] ligase
MVADPSTLTDVNALQQQLEQGCATFADAQVLAQVGSSNQYLLEAPVPQTLRPIVVWALEQITGRGRRGRPWVGQIEHSLMVSMSFFRRIGEQAPEGVPKPSLSGLPIAVGVALAKTLSQYAPLIQLKWPNDLQRAGRKCGGILIESRQRDSNSQQGAAAARVEQVVVGVGLNLYVDQSWQQAIAQPACGVFDRLPYPPRATIATQVAQALNDTWKRYQLTGISEAIVGWSQWDALYGVEVRVTDADRILFEGTAQGLAPSGSLRVVTQSGLREVSFGDVSVRRKTD